MNTHMLTGTGTTSVPCHPKNQSRRQMFQKRSKR